MSIMTLDESTVNKLRACGADVEIRDPQGNVVGFFRAAGVHIYDEGVIPEVPEEEMRRRLASKERIPADEVMRRLRGSP